MFKITHYYNNQNFDFSFLSNFSINNDSVIKFLIKRGFYSLSQCPEELSFLVESFPFEQVDYVLSTLTNLSYNSFTHMNQLIEMIVLNQFSQGISVYSVTQMNNALQTFNLYFSRKQITRRELAKLIRDNNYLIHSGKGQYIHASKLLYVCYRRKKATSDLLIALDNLIKENNKIDGRVAYDLLKFQCASLSLSNPYALYGFIECFKPQNMSYNQDKFGIIIYQQKKHTPKT